MLKHIHKLAEKIFKYAVAAVILAVPLYPKFPFMRIPGTYVSIRLEDFVLFAVGCILAIVMLPRLKEFLTDKVHRSIFLFLLVGLLSVASAIVLTNTVVPHIGVLHWLRRVEYLLCFFIGVYAVRDKKDLAFFIKCFLIVIFIAFIYGLGQKYWSWPVITTQNDEYAKGVALRFMPGGHLVSTFAGHYDLATFIVLLMPALVVLLTLKAHILKSFNFSVIPMRIVLIISFFMSLWLLVNTASRISIAAYFLSVTIALLLTRKFKFLPIVLIISFLFISTSSNLMQRYVRIFEVYVQKVIKVEKQSLYLIKEVSAETRRNRDATPAPEAVQVFEDRSTSIRLNVEWPRAIRAFRKNPLLGTGFSSITLATDNDYLRLLGELGILGFLSFGLIFYKIGLAFLTKTKWLFSESFESSFCLAIIASIPGVFLNALFIDVFEASKFAIIFWLVLGFAYKLSKTSGK